MGKIEYLRVITNNTCNLSCFFCHKEGVDCKNKASHIDTHTLYKMIEILIDQGIKKIKFLGGEPTLCKELPILIKMIKNHYPDTDVSMISNGVVSIKLWEQYLDSGLDRINISLHGFVGDVFKAVTKGNDFQLQQVMTSIDYLKKHNILGKVNYVILKNVNEEEFYNVLEYAVNNDLVLDVLNYLDTDQNAINKYYYSFDEILNLIRKKHDIKKIEQYQNKYSLPSTRLHLNPAGVINLKTTSLNSVDFLNGCSVCSVKQFCSEGISAIRLTNKGVIKPCIFRDDNCFDLKKCLSEKQYDHVCLDVKEYLEGL